MRAEFPSLIRVEPLPGQRIHAAFSDGAEMTVELGDKIASLPALVALAEPAVFATASVGEYGHNLAFSIGEVFGADNVYAWGIEQRGETSHAMLWEWMHRNGLTQERAAEAIGISRRMLSYYLAAAKPIPKTVWLACLGFEAEQKRIGKRHAGKGSRASSRAAV